MNDEKLDAHRGGGRRRVPRHSGPRVGFLGTVVLCGVALALAGCSTAGPSASAGSGLTIPPVGSGYLASGSSYVIFIQWIDTNGNVNGTAQNISVADQPPNASTQTDTLSVFGQVNGSRLTLRFSDGNEQFGTMSSSGFTINFPQPDGTLAPITFHAASTADFNRAVDKLRTGISKANTVAANAQRLAQLEQTIDGDASQVATRLAAFGPDERTMSADLQSVLAGVQQTASDLSAVQSAEQQVSAESPTTTYPQGACGDASGVAGDASGVAGDASGVGGDAGAIQADLSPSSLGVGSDVTILQNDWSQLANDEKSVPGYQPPNAPSANDVSQALASANSAIQVTLSTTNGYIDQANADVATAYQYADQAFQTAGCGTSPTPPTPIQHIS